MFTLRRFDFKPLPLSYPPATAGARAGLFRGIRRILAQKRSARGFCPSHTPQATILSAIFGAIPGYRGNFREARFGNSFSGISRCVYCKL